MYVRICTCTISINHLLIGQPSVFKKYVYVDKVETSIAMNGL